MIAAESSPDLLGAGITATESFLAIAVCIFLVERQEAVKKAPTITINTVLIIFTFSCSQVVDKKLFYDTVVSSAIQSGRNVKVIEHLSQPPDHPVSIFHPEGEYLKGLVLYVD